MVDCSGCGRKVNGNATHCMFCGARLPAPHERLPGSPKAIKELARKGLRCPGCAIAIDYRERESFGWAECSRCRGQYLDGATLDFLIHQKAQQALREKTAARSAKGVARAIPKATPEYRKCPVCFERMNRNNYGSCSGVLIDECAEHGVWLDAGELTQLLDFAATGGVELANRYAESAKRRARSQQRVIEYADMRLGPVEPPDDGYSDSVDILIRLAIFAATRY
jgi:Zn-finger nucleic acid-binding protein